MEWREVEAARHNADRINSMSGLMMCSADDKETIAAIPDLPPVVFDKFLCSKSWIHLFPDKTKAVSADVFRHVAPKINRAIAIMFARKII